VIENRSSTNPTQVDGASPAGPLPLNDGSHVDVGGYRLTFWDLAAGDQYSGPVCSHCHRENSETDADCWFCGTSLVNAPTSIRTRRNVVCRLIASDGTAFDLIDQKALLFRPDGTEQKGARNVNPADPTVSSVDGRPAVRGSGITVEGATAQSAGGEQAHILSSGDRIRIGDRPFVAIVR
jgi:hypothetical protein